MPFCHMYIAPGTKRRSDHHDLPPQLGDNPAYGIFAGPRTSTTTSTTHQTSSTRQEVMEEGLTVPSSMAVIMRNMTIFMILLISDFSMNKIQDIHKITTITTTIISEMVHA